MLDFLTDSVIQNNVTLNGLILSTAASLLLGMGVAGVYMLRNKYNKSFVVTLALLPSMIQVIIMLVNGNVGAGIAVVGAFSLVRFRSIPGSAREIGSIFFAMAIGLAIGLGYLLYASIFFVIVGAANILLMLSKFGNEKQDIRILKITIPENIDHEGLFDDLFAQYTNNAELDRVKTTNMGSLYELTYNVQMKTSAAPKSFIDAIRCRNGNLNIVLGRPTNLREEL